MAPCWAGPQHGVISPRAHPRKQPSDTVSAPISALVDRMETLRRCEGPGANVQWGWSCISDTLLARSADHRAPSPQARDLARPCPG